MNECLKDSDLLELTEESLASFDQRLTMIPEDLCAPFHQEARQLDAELLTVYRVVVLCAKREDDLERVSRWWETMVRVCDAFAARLGKLVASHPYCGAQQYYDRVLDLRSKCLRLQMMHNHSLRCFTRAKARPENFQESADPTLPAPSPSD